MAKLSENQRGGVDALRRAIAAHGVPLVDKSAWKKHAENGVSINTGSLAKAGAVTVTRAQVGARTVELFAPTQPTSEIGG